MIDQFVTIVLMRVPGEILPCFLMAYLRMRNKDSLRAKNCSYNSPDFFGQHEPAKYVMVEVHEKQMTELAVFVFERCF